MGDRKRDKVINDEEGTVKRAALPAPPYVWSDECERLYLDLIVQGIRNSERVAGSFKPQF